MAAQTPTDTSMDETLWLTSAESLDSLTLQVRRATGLSSIEEFLDHLDRGEWDDVIDDPDHRDILGLATFFRS